MGQYDADSRGRNGDADQRVTDIRSALVAARGQTVQSPTFSFLYDQVRQMCDRFARAQTGTVPFFANQLQRVLEGALENSYRFSDHDYRRFARTMTELEREISSPSVGESRPPSEEGRDGLIVYIIEPKTAPLRELYEQLRYYGMQTIALQAGYPVESISTRARIAVAIVDATALDEQPTLRRELRELRSRRVEGLRIVVVAEVDSFQSRLAGVRAGGDAFSALPVDLATFMSQIDAFSVDGSRHPNHVLVIDDSPEEVADIALILQQAGMVTSVVTEPPHVFQVLIERKPDLIIMSAELVGCTGVELAAVIRQQEAFVAVPILFVSSADDALISADSIRADGDEVITKPLDADRLVRSVSVRLKRSRDTRYLMERDSLTGLLNHINLKESLTTEIQRAQRIGTNVSFAMVDIDHFKKVNDTYGHLVGDRVLLSLARLLEERLRKTDTVGRYGGEEFGVVFFNTDVFDAAATMNRIRDSFSHLPHQLSESQFTVTFSCGVGSFPEYRTPASLTAAADKALYTAKQAGRNRVISA